VAVFSRARSVREVEVVDNLQLSHAVTAHGRRSGTKATKTTTITRKNCFVFVVFVTLVVFVPER